MARSCGGQTLEASRAVSLLIQQGDRPVLAEDLYANPFSTYTIDTLAGTLVRPSYLSLEYALHFHNVLP